MTHNWIYSVCPETLLAYAESLLVEAVPERGFGAEESAAVRSAIRATIARNKAVAQAEAALSKIRLERDAARQTLAEEASALTRELRARLPSRYAVPTSSYRRSRPLAAPERPTATLEPGGRLTLRWRRAGNPRGVAFVVEQLLVDGGWTQAGFTPGAKLTLDDQGETPSGFFRVSATDSGELSRPSSVVTPKKARPVKAKGRARRRAA